MPDDVEQPEAASAGEPAEVPERPQEAGAVEAPEESQGAEPLESVESFESHATEAEEAPEGAETAESPEPSLPTEAPEAVETPNPVETPDPPHDASLVDTPERSDDLEQPQASEQPEAPEPIEPAERAEAPERPSVAAPATEPQTPRQRLTRSIRPAFSRSQLMVGLLCALLGFALVVQVRQSGQAELSSLRQDDLVRLLDEVTGRAEQLDAEVSRLQTSRDELASGTGQAQAALEVAQQRATSEGILSGRLPAQGPGVVVTVRDPGGDLTAQHLFNMLEELRNAGAEVVQLGDLRLVTSSSFVDAGQGISVDGTVLTPPYRWTVIGDPATLDRALEIPGGALPTIRSAGGTATTEQETQVTIDAVIDLTDPRFARPVETGDRS
ncbi:protein of unknown function DUF881 [Xylanimonas cellulosilytica DSM 15894]|uniref:Division initiation protein n=1 Tax=Xylanimonas cellulosilytica (strain DSM 15894 / JCM 12276 / CECT 5975 / KCTC 9989 / LMG 20990 / NBRC 107835 / XIL07) TaxID=446471 RepID=D1BSR8_XYLCX|nr:protein of unknown function DUF881 [Xylanimonas cellulosilytica DSM 15894]